MTQFYRDTDTLNRDLKKHGFYVIRQTYSDRGQLVTRRIAPTTFLSMPKPSRGKYYDKRNDTGWEQK